MEQKQQQVTEEQSSGLKRGLKNRHIQLIALGGAVGTGLFLGLYSTLKLAGPSVILGYLLAGGIAFLIMRQLGEMIVDEPAVGSFSYFAFKYWGKFPGFVAGWNYWMMFILVGMSELTAIAQFVQYWYPIAAWQSVLFFFLLVNAINFFSVRLYGEIEFVFSIIKIFAVSAMIVVGGYVLLSGNGGENASISNIWQLEGGFFPFGISGFIMAIALIMFSFGGLETVGIVAAEAESPRSTIPKAINQILWRILVFYIGSLVVLLALTPWQELIVRNGSPFVMIFEYFNLPYLGTVLNIVILTAALSVYNCGVYVNSRMLYGLAQQGNAPRALISVNRQGVPVRALLISAFATAFGVLLNYLMPGQVFSLLMALVVSTLVINWIMICLAHLKFRQAKAKEAGYVTNFAALFYPIGNYITLAFLFGVLLVLLCMPGLRISVLLIPVWLLVLWWMFKLRRPEETSEH